MLGVIPQDAELTTRHAEIPAWDEMPAISSRCSRSRWRSTPASSSRADHHVGRLIETLEDLGILEDTLVYYIIGDNGASAEGTIKAASTR